jgi:predicted aspartyl protease
MNRSIFQIRLLLCLSLIAIALPTLHAEPRCPANIAAVTPRFIRRALIVIPVKVNHAGPFDFMVDTGAQITVVDPSLASQLGLKPQGTVGLVSAASHAHTPVAVLDSLEAASHVVERALVLTLDLAPFQAADPRIRGVLGENFLAHFDLLIDYRRKLLCLDHTRMMRDEVHGEHVPLSAPQHHEDEAPFTERLVIPVLLSGTGTRQVLLQLDSGSDVPVLYEKTKLPLLESAMLLESSMSKARVPFAAFEPQVMRIGTRTLGHVSFVTPVSVAKEMPARDEDGLLPTVLFQRVFICHADQYVIFDPR